MSETVKGIYINDSVHGLIRLSEFEKDIVSSVGFNRLHDIYQNSTAYLTYPSNRTKRFEHSIGTMKLCSDMFYSAVLNSSEDNLKKFYNSYSDVVIALIEEFKKSDLKEYESVLNKTPKGIPEVTLDIFRKSLISSNVPCDFVYIHILLIQSVRIAALLHDIGHPPFSHIVEFALKDSKTKYSGNQNTERQKSFSSKMADFPEDKPLHETMGIFISQNILQTIIKKSKNKSSDSETFFKILVLKCVERIFADEGLFSYLHKIIDGTLDGDRLDYVTRDSSNSGLNVGSVDYSRIIKEIKILYYKDPKSNKDVPWFCVPVKSINSVEDFLRRRYDLYKNVINHHRVIKTDFLLENTVKDLVVQYLDNVEAVEQENNDSNVIPFDISGLWFPLEKGMLEEKNSALAQWNDSWLITILKQIYYKEYKDKHEKESVKFKTSCQLAELLENKKNYYSLVKRSEDFRIIDNAVANIIKNVAENLENKIKELEEKSEDSEKTDTSDFIDEAGTLSYIRALIKNCEKKGCEFLLADLLQNKRTIQFEDIESEIKKIVNDKITESHGIDDVQTVFKTISKGLGETIYFYDNNDRLYALDEISGIATTLKRENLFRPVFYVYVLTTESRDEINNGKEKILERLGEAIGNRLIEQFNKIIESQMNEFDKVNA